MELRDILKVLNGQMPVPKYMAAKLKRWRDVYYGISLHTTGTEPAYKDLKYGFWTKGLDWSNVQYTYPASFICNEYQFLFETKLMSRHPREPEELRWWRYSQYRPLTKAPFIQAIEVIVGAISQDSTYVIDIPNKEDSAYINQNKYQGYDLIGYLFNIGMKHIIEDPNGFFIDIPEYSMNEQDPSKKLDVTTWFVNSKDIVWFTDDEVIFKRDYDKWAYYVNKEVIFRFYHDERKGNKWVILPEDREGYFAHMQGKLPITIAGGDWNTHGYYDSYFDKAKAWADEFVSSFSAAQMVDKEASHPWIVMANMDCPECRGIGQYQGCGECNNSSDNCTCESGVSLSLINCGNCSGTGKVSQNPGQRVYVPYNEMKENGLPVAVVNPDVSINKQNRDVANYILETILKTLHLYNTDKSESGEAKAIDQERRYNFCDKIATHIFYDIIHDRIANYAAYRNVISENNRIKPAVYDFTITKPIQYDVVSSSDLLDELDKSTKANIPVYLRNKIAEDYIDKRYSGNELLKRKARIINAIDTLSGMTSAEIMSLRSTNAITQEQVVLHINISGWIDDIIEMNGAEWFKKATKENVLIEVNKLIPEAVEKLDLTEPIYEQG